MSQREKMIFRIGRFIVVFAVGLWIWPILLFAAWYIKNIPDKTKNLPFGGWLRTHQTRFYDWLSGFMKTWLIWSVIYTGFFCAPLVVATMVDILVSGPSAFLYRNLLVVIFLSYFSYVIATGYLGFSSAESAHWRLLLWRAEPAARALLGEYDDPNAKPDPDLVRHVVDAEIGINKATWIVSRGECKMHHPAADKLAKFGGPGVLIVEEGHAVVLVKSGQLSRVLGRGLHFLMPFERPQLVVPLTAQAVRLEVEYAITQDGGVLDKVEGLVFCKLDSGRRNRDSQARYPFDDELIISKVWNPKGGSAADSVGAVKPISESALRQVIARHTLHEFFDNFEQARLKLRDELVEEANRLTGAITGFMVVAAAINRIAMPKETETKLWQRWGVVQDEKIVEKQTEIDLERILKMSEGEATKLSREEMARAQVELERLKQMIDIDATKLERVEKARTDAEAERLTKVDLERLKQMTEFQLEQLMRMSEREDALRIEAFLRLIGTLQDGGFDPEMIQNMVAQLTRSRIDTEASRRLLRRILGYGRVLVEPTTRQESTSR